VKVDWQTGLYHDKLDICAGGSPGNPVTVEGVPGPEGELPILEANGAIENPDASYQHADVFGTAGLITVAPSATAQHISDVVIKNFELRHATRNSAFTDFTGTLRDYAYSSSGVAIYSADNVTVTGCNIYGNENGIFAKSQGWDAGDCHYLTISRDKVHGNGLVGSDRCHNTYIEAAYTLYEFDTYGPLATGAEAGTNLADRGVGTVIRYCHLTGGSNVINLIEPDDGAPSLDNLPGFGTEWVYGCVVVNPNGSSCNVIIHFGTDNDGPTGQSVLWFYDNTVVSYNDYVTGGRYYTYVFSGWSDITINAMNNIFDSVSPTPGDWSGEWALANGGSYGSTVTVFLGVNWAPSGFEQYRPGDSVVVTGWANMLMSTDDPFVNVMSHDYRLRTTSVCVAAAGSLQGQSAPQYQWDPLTNSWIARRSNNNLGGIEAVV
jgi:hypothetical protein